MAKKKTISKQESAPVVKNEVEVVENNFQSTPSWTDKLVNGFVPYIIMFVLSFAIYSNTFKHQFALDDDIVICKNEYVLKGVSGIGDIFSKDLFASFYHQMNTSADQLTGGRYRPLSVASFAIEQEFIGTMTLPDSILNINDSAQKQMATNVYLDKYLKTKWDKNNNGVGDAGEDINEDGVFNDKDTKVMGCSLRHINNVLFYGLSVCVLFLFLSSVVFKQNKIVAFIVSLLFLAHPIHTEVIANMKSRDEIFSLIFMLLTLFFAHQIEKKNALKFTILTCVSFLCALLSKEYGATLIVLVPLSLYLFSDKKFEFSKYMSLYIGIVVTFIVYVGMRSQAGHLFAKSDVQETEILNSPYLFAEGAEELATKIFMLLKYFGIMLLPKTLCSDYGYNSIPYKNFTDLSVWASLILLIGMIVAGFISLKKKSWVAFALAFYLLNLALISNFIFNVGATMGERLVFHSSVGFCMLLGYGIYWVAKKINNPSLVIVFVLPIVILYSMKTYSRNAAWKNDISLALTDVEINPNSTSLNGNAASRNIDLSELPDNKSKENDYLQKAIKYGRKAITLHPAFVNGHLNLGLAFAKISEYDSAKAHWDIAFRLYPHHPQKDVYYNLLADTYYQKGISFGRQQKWAEGKYYLLKVVEINPNNARYWYDLGGFAYNSQDIAKAKEAWTKAFQLNPNDPEIQKVQGLIR